MNHPWLRANLVYVLGYNAKAVVDEDQIVLAAEITNTPGDFSNLDPMIYATLDEEEAALSPRCMRRLRPEAETAVA